MKKGILIAVGVLVLGAIVFWSIRAGQGEKGAKVYAEAAGARDIAQVIKASGAIDPKEKVNISAHVVGKIEKLFVQEGDRIEAGKPFLRLEQQAYIAQRDQWAAQLRSSQTGVAKAQAQLADTRVRLERARNLSRQGVIPLEQLQTAELQETSARLEVEAARQAVEQANANLVKAADDLTKTTIYAPLSGRVVKLNAEQGEVVVSGTMNMPGSIIGTIADLSEILAKVDVDETEIVDVRVGQDAVVKVDAIPARPYHGKIIEVGSSGFSKPAQPDVTFFEVKILLADADDRLRPGMSVRSEIRASFHPLTLVVPIQANKGIGPYNVAKFGVVALTETLRLECEGTGVGVSVLCPGAVDTRIVDAERNRPSDVPGSAGATAERFKASSTAMLGTKGLAPSEVAAMVVDAVRTDRFWVLTHPDWYDVLSQRVAAMPSGGLVGGFGG